jgi:telomerase reverse transcriptase
MVPLSQPSTANASTSEEPFVTQAFAPKNSLEKGRPKELEPSRTQLKAYHDSLLQESSEETDQVKSKQKKCFMDYATPSSSVSAFCRAVLCKVVPNAFFGVGEGGNDNRRLIMKQVDWFIRMSRFESLSLHEVCKGLKVSHQLSHTYSIQMTLLNIHRLLAQDHLYSVA